jgi:undecaprenyl-diphosphatase
VSTRQLAIVVALIAGAVFAGLTIAVTTGSTHGMDAAAFEIGSDIRAPWLDHLARAFTTLGLIAIVAPAVGACTVLLLIRRRLTRAAALAAGCALEWGAAWIVKYVVDRPRPSHPLVHTAGASYPSAHAANSVGWLALALAAAVLIPNRPLRITTVLIGGLITVLVGLSRIYLRAHYLSDVIAGEALAVSMYALAVIGALTWLGQRAAISATPSTSASTSDSSL